MTSDQVLRRRPEGRVLAGVAAGLASYLGLPAAAVRLAFVVLAAAGGMGLAAYAVLWVLLPMADGRTLRGDRRGQAQLVVLLVGVAALSALAPWQVLPGGAAVGALAAASVGVALLWQQADEVQRARWRSSATGSSGAVLRLGAGGVLLAAGLVGFLASRGQLANARAGLLSTVVVVGGLVLVSSPWWVAMAADLRAERTARIRSQERAEVAAHLHDSVLQTLALIQRSSGSPQEVTRLARSQERELRSWLYAERHDGGTFASALERAAAEVEDALAVPVEVVVVGDCALDEPVGAVVAAAREAILNAAKHSGAPSVDVYAEVEPTDLTVFVRDRGCGFDPASVPADRHGVAGSIVGRMARHGGAAVVRSTLGAGTEVRLELSRG